MPKLDLNVVFTFAASHFLTKYHGKCENLHGHNYKLVVKVSGGIKDDGMVIDYKEVKKIVKKHVISEIDHKHLNELVDNPSSENITVWIWERLKKHLPLKKITLYETEKYFCEYQGE